MKKLYTIALALLVTGATSCDKSLEVDIPVGFNSTAVMFSNIQSANNAVRGLYEGLSGGLFAGVVPFQRFLSENLGLLADDLDRASYSVSEGQFHENNLLVANAEVRRFWDKFYNYVYQSNMVIAGATASEQLTEVQKNGLVGEAKFIRALSYFYLVNLFGNVPLTLQTDYLINRSLAANTRDEVYLQMIEDLKFAKVNIPDGNTVVGARYRASKWAATALLARVYLYHKDWANAEAEATAVINQQTIYKLETLEQVFTAASTEAILCLDNPSQINYSSESGISGFPLNNVFCRLSPFLISQFLTGDQRGVTWVRTGTGTGVGTKAPLKYKAFLNSPAGTKKEAPVILRLAEQYLIRAEARAMQIGKEALAIADLDVIRTRAGALPNNTQDFQTIAFSKPGISKPDLIDAIYNERLLEMFAEFGHRWLDAKRSGISLDTFFEGRKPGIVQTDAYLPIPSEELLLNKNLKQNEGYFQ